GRLPFTGHAVWVGCDQDVDVPRALAEEWQQTQTGERAAVLPYWLHPKALPGPRLRLAPGDRVEARVEKQSGPQNLAREQTIKVRKQSFPQVEDWDAP